MTDNVRALPTGDPLELVADALARSAPRLTTEQAARLRPAARFLLPAVHDVPSTGSGAQAA